METCTTFGQQPPLPAPTPCVCVHEHVGNFMPRRQMSQHTTTQRRLASSSPWRKYWQAHVCSSAKLCNYATASFREIVNIPPQFPVLAVLLFSVLNSLLGTCVSQLSCSLHYIPFVFVFVIRPHTDTRSHPRTKFAATAS